MKLADNIIQTLENKIKGNVLLPKNEGYEEVRKLWNGRFDPRPAVIVQCTDADDITVSVNIARKNNLPLSVKGGGHSYAGNSICDDGLAIDLSPMNSIQIDPDKKIARVDGGATIGEFDREAQQYGLATTGGTCSTTGVGGYTLGGGTGYLSRKYGTASDNLIAADVVTAAGKQIRANKDGNSDLFWALRGGSGNFGVVFSFEYKLHEVGPEVLAGQIVYPFEDAPEVLRHYRDFMNSAPDEIQCYAFILRVPPIPAFPEKFHNKLAIDLVVCYTGDAADGEEALHELRNFGDPILDGVFVQPYTELQQAFDAGLAEKGRRWYSKTHYLNELSDEAINTMLKQAEQLPGPFSVAYVEAEGGAIGRVDPAETAFPHRDASYAMHIFPGWIDPENDDKCIEQARKFHSAMAPFATGGAYVNLLGGDEQEGIKAAFGENYEKLTRIKKKWDPENLFSKNHNINPAG